MNKDCYTTLHQSIEVQSQAQATTRTYKNYIENLLYHIRYYN